MEAAGSRAPVGSHVPVTTRDSFRQLERTARKTRAGLQRFDHSRLGNSSGNPRVAARMAGPNGH